MALADDVQSMAKDISNLRFGGSHQSSRIALWRLLGMLNNRTQAVARKAAECRTGGGKCFCRMLLLAVTNDIPEQHLGGGRK